MNGDYQNTVNVVTVQCKSTFIGHPEAKTSKKFEEIFLSTGSSL